jgi:hypothetical protein
MATDIQAFTPASSYVISATASTGNTALTQPPAVAGSAGNAGGNTRIKCYNASASNICYLQPSTGTLAATTSSPFLVPPATWVTFEVGYAPTNLAVITNTSTATLYVMLGGGF